MHITQPDSWIQENCSICANACTSPIWIRPAHKMYMTSRMKSGRIIGIKSSRWSKTHKKNEKKRTPGYPASMFRVGHKTEHPQRLQPSVLVMMNRFIYFVVMPPSSSTWTCLVDSKVWTLSSGNSTLVLIHISACADGIVQTGTTYVKPLMMLYSCLMTPPFSLAVALALRIYVSTKAFDIMVMRHTFPAPRRERRSSGWSREMLVRIFFWR